MSFKCHNRHKQIQQIGFRKGKNRAKSNGKEKAPTKNTYKVGDKFDKTGMTVVAKYSDGTSKEITNYTVANGDKLTEGQTSVKISYTEGNVTKTIEQKITVVENIDVSSNNKSEFQEIKEDNTKTEDTMPKQE